MRRLRESKRGWKKRRERRGAGVDQGGMSPDVVVTINLYAQLPRPSASRPPLATVLWKNFSLIFRSQSMAQPMADAPDNPDLQRPFLQQPSPLLSQESIMESLGPLAGTTVALEASAAPIEGHGYQTREHRRHQTYLGNTGYMQMFSKEDSAGNQASPKPVSLQYEATTDSIPEDLLDTYLETYFEYANVWCPVLDRDVLRSHPEILESPVLQNALALCGTRLRPPLVTHMDPGVHYNRAKSLLYANCESNPLVQIIAIMLFYWWSPGQPNIAGLDTGRWWVGTAIRLAEEIGLHQEMAPTDSYIGETAGLKRRIWWTLFVGASLSNHHPQFGS